jgi:fluoride ion exporter CrcB/FEX
VLIVSIVEVWRPPRLVRPFLGVGLLGGYTTFSTYAVDTQRLIQDGDPRTAFAYLARYLTDRFIQARRDTVFPWGTLTVNVASCLIFGALMGVATPVASTRRS